MIEKNIYLISGMSGSGKSVCLRHFEDMEYEVIRGLPVEFLEHVIQHTSSNLAIEIFSKPLIANQEKVLDIIKRYNIKVVFLDTSNKSLLLRYKESRRMHPFDGDFVQKGIDLERTGLQFIRDIADYTIDTSETTPYELKMIINKEILESTGQMKAVVMSFSYKKGIPIEADCVFDVRFLKNPYYDPALRSLNGAEKKIQEYLKNDQNVSKYIDETKGYLDTIIDLLQKEGRDLFYIAFGCTGGFHRSVFVAETIAEHLKSRGIATSLLHRDLKIFKN